MRKHCGCTTNSCGCCEGTRTLTPATIENRSGMPTIGFRVGTHGTFLETMRARLANIGVDAPGPDGQTLQSFRPLQSLTTRDRSDFAIALLDGWATIADVLTFYQERIANEGYLRTATERRSVLELARLLGYTLRPGVAATVFLAYSLDDNQKTPVVIPAGTAAQSVPVQSSGELPQTFETSEDLFAKTEWNNLQIRRTRPQTLTLENALDLESLYISTDTTNLKSGDLFLLVFGEKDPRSVVRIVASVESEVNEKRLRVHLQPLPAVTARAFAVLDRFIEAARPKITTSASPASSFLMEKAVTLQGDVRLGAQLEHSRWIPSLDEWKRHGELDPSIADLYTRLTKSLAGLREVPKPQPEKSTTSPSAIVEGLLKSPSIQPRSAAHLSRSLSASFKPGSDSQPKMLLNFAPELNETFYSAWATAEVNPSVTGLKGVFVLRSSASLFGSASQGKLTISRGDEDVVNPHFTPWPVFPDERPNALFLELPNESILSSGYVLIQKALSDGTLTRSAHAVVAAQTTQRIAYGMSGKTTRLTLADNWWSGSKDHINTLQGAYVHVQSEKLNLADEPIDDPLDSETIELATLEKDLVSGRWVILSGERADIPNVTGVRVAELAMLSGVEQYFDPKLLGDRTHTRLTLSSKPAFGYKRESLMIYANVVKATHGATKNEILGNGDGSLALQTFTLKQSPITYVPAPIPAGVESTLRVYVNNVEWHETDTLAGLARNDRKFVIRTDEHAIPTLIFGNGVNGARLPTGAQNVTSVYRGGIGQPGNVLAGQISLLQTKPLGVQAVINPLGATGGADKETLEEARGNAPIAVSALDRLVSVPDYANFARTFAGIAKTEAIRISDGHRQLIYVTIAGSADIPIDPNSDLFVNLVTALKRLGDTDLAVRVEARELITLVLSARVRLEPDRLWDVVAAQIRITLLETFGFEKRNLGQPALLCEVLSAIQGVDGVTYVDVDAFGGVHEKVLGPNGVQRISIEQLTEAIAKIAGDAAPKSRTSPREVPSERVDARLGRLDNGVLRPAELARFTADIPDTIILNAI